MSWCCLYKMYSAFERIRVMPGIGTESSRFDFLGMVDDRCKESWKCSIFLLCNKASYILKDVLFSSIMTMSKHIWMHLSGLLLGIIYFVSACPISLGWLNANDMLVVYLFEALYPPVFLQFPNE